MIDRLVDSENRISRKDNCIYQPPNNRRKALAERRKIRSVLSQWYSDDENLQSAMMKYLPKVISIGEVISSFMAKKLPQQSMKLIEIQKNWEMIAGSATAKRSYPLKFLNKILYIEVSHPAYVRILDSQKVKSQLMLNIGTIIGPDCCCEIKFVPIGRRNPQPVVNKA